MSFWHRIGDNIANAAPGSWLLVISSLSGVLIGALIPIIKAYVDHLLEKRRERKKVAISLSRKLNSMISSIQIVQSHFEDGLARAELSNAHPGMVTQAMNRISDEVSFTDDNIWAITQICGSQGVNAFGPLDNQFNVLMRAVDSYANLRTELQAMMPKLKAVNETTISYEISPDDENAGEIVVRISELDNFVVTMIDHCKKNKAATVTALTVLLKAKKFPYPKMRMHFEPVTGLAPVAARKARPGARSNA